MKTTQIFRLALILFAAFSLAITSCQKEEEPEPKVEEEGSTSLQQLSEDDQFQQQVSDDIDKDVESVMNGQASRDMAMLPCNVTVDSTGVVNDTITYFITYHGLNCWENLYRTGQVRVRRHVGTKWWMPDATVSVKIINLQVTKVATGKSIVINGMKQHKNVSGGFILQLGYGVDHIIHRTIGHMKISFENGAAKTWKIARRLVYTGTWQDYSLAINGFGEDGSYSDLVTWGTTRTGDQFYISTPQPIIHKEACGWDPVSGIHSMDIPTADMGATLTFGFDNNNQPVTNGDCPTKFKLDWYHNGNSGTIFLWL